MSRNFLRSAGPSLNIFISFGVNMTMFKLPTNSLNFFNFIPLCDTIFLLFNRISISPILSFFSYSPLIFANCFDNIIISLSLLVLKDFPNAIKNMDSIMFVFPCALSP